MERSPPIFEQYPLNRDALASARLNLQHQLWIDGLGYLLHPKITIPEHAMIADVGCGTGIWSLSLAKQLEQTCRGASIEAFDLSLAQTLPKEWSPSDVSYQQMNIFDPLPEKLIGRYDIVHVRLFLLVVEKGDPMPLLRQLFKLLKPGGFLQWQEYDPKSDKIVLAEPSLAAPKLENLYATLKATGSVPDMEWVTDLHTRFEREGGEMLVSDRTWGPKGLLGIKQETIFLVVREWSAKLRSQGQHQTANQMEALCAEVGEECWALGRGSAIDTAMLTWVARKNSQK